MKLSCRVLGRGCGQASWVQQPEATGGLCFSSLSFFWPAYLKQEKKASAELFSTFTSSITSFLLSTKMFCFVFQKSHFWSNIALLRSKKVSNILRSKQMQKIPSGVLLLYTFTRINFRRYSLPTLGSNMEHLNVWDWSSQC